MRLLVPLSLVDPTDRKESGWMNGAAVVVHVACTGQEVEP